MVMALTTFVRSTEAIANHTVKSFQAKVTEYNDFLQNNFDGTTNYTSPMAQIYLSSKSNNEVFTLKKMLQEPDKEHFIAAMEEEVASMF